MSHANAALTPKARLRLARVIVEDVWKPAAAAKMDVHGLNPDGPQVGRSAPRLRSGRDA